MLRGDDKALLGIPDSEQRDLLLEQLSRTEARIKKFESYDAAITTIWSGEIKNYIPLLKDFLLSGIDPPQVLHMIIQLLNQPDIDQRDVVNMVILLPITTLIRCT